MKTIGQNSPAIPYPAPPSRAGSIGGLRPRRSERASRERSSQRDAEQPPLARRAPPPADRDRSPARAPARSSSRPCRYEARAGHPLVDHLDPRDKEEEPRPKLERKLTYGIDVRDSSTCGPIRIPSRISHDHGGENDPSAQPREERSKRRGKKDEHDRSKFRARDQGCANRPRRAARCGRKRPAHQGVGGRLRAYSTHHDAGGP